MAKIQGSESECLLKVLHLKLLNGTIVVPVFENVNQWNAGNTTGFQVCQFSSAVLVKQFFKIEHQHARPGVLIMSLFLNFTVVCFNVIPFIVLVVL